MLNGGLVGHSEVPFLDCFVLALKNCYVFIFL